MSDVVRYETRNRIALITLNRPDQRNAVDPAMATALAATIARVESDDGIDVAVLTGAGDRAFSAGADLKAVAAGSIDQLRVDPGGFAGFVRYPRTKPVIAAVNGFALAGGCEIALACDIVLAADCAVFGLPEVTRGLIAAGGGMFRLMRAIPEGRALELMLTGDRVDAVEAARLGLVSRVLAPDALLDAALDVAARISANAPLAVRATLAVARAAIGADEAQCWEYSDAAARTTNSSPDALEGARAFAARRPPVWTGRLATAPEGGR